MSEQNPKKCMCIHIGTQSKYMHVILDIYALSSYIHTYEKNKCVHSSMRIHTDIHTYTHTPTKSVHHKPLSLGRVPQAEPACGMALELRASGPKGARAKVLGGPWAPEDSCVVLFVGSML